MIKVESLYLNPPPKIDLYGLLSELHEIDMKLPLLSNSFYFKLEHRMIIMESSENNKDSKNYVEFVFYRVPKKNHESLLQVTNQLIELLKQEKVSYDCFGLISAEKIPGFISITKIIPINPVEEDIWINIVTYKDRQHRSKVVEKISKDKECQDIYEEFMQLITPNTEFVNGEFRNLVSS